MRARIAAVTARASLSAMTTPSITGQAAADARDRTVFRKWDPAPSLRAAVVPAIAEHAGLLGPTGSARVIEHVRLRTTAAAHSSAYLGATDDAPPPDAAGPSDIPHDVPAAFAAGALLGVAADWLQRGCPRRPLEMTILTKPLLLALSAVACTPPTP
ncbi:hypothetical protein [Streptomyces sp. NPDC093591]|uniref:hypothetical protein n=1 Tax=Streptomyces sp. NPDC093591 TaxID=3366044 RepID=UPI003829E9A2